ncbi:MAG: MotA/TolQ/ExbB proton channel family protein [Treponema sp.]|jgi:biopolymer transport protein ExbB|nr:MotA/TolQ/ExbB proton channel family protein [Treponema sp.]
MESGTVSFSLLDLFKMGGVFMWPLLAFSIATITIGVERAVYFIRHSLEIGDLGGKVSQLVKSGGYQEAAEYLSAQTGRRMGARVLLALVNRANTGGGKAFSEHHAERAVETEAMTCINSMENGFNFLVALGSLSPLTGFLGTVSGMIGAFKSIAEATEVNAQIVANGIYEALITTVFGLIIAIIAMIFHSVFSHIVDKFAAEIETTCSDLIAEIADSQP